MNTNKLYLEYARVIEMCKGTVLEDNPWLGVRIALTDGNTGYFDHHPDLRGIRNEYSFLVAILEDKPVFIGDVVYDARYPETFYTATELGFELSTCNHTYAYYSENTKSLTWRKPKPKRTFNLNGVELPCPDNNEQYTLVLGLGEAGYTGYEPVSRFNFSKDDALKVYSTLCDILEKAKNE